MSIPVNARVRAVPNFLACLEVARSFKVEQRVDSASARFKKLQAELHKARGLLAFAPTSGRPTWFLNAKTGWGQYQSQQAVQLARHLGMPELRELVLARHVLLYAASERDVLLLALRHERELGYRLPG